jgi:hypothetical protein
MHINTNIFFNMNTHVLEATKYFRGAAQSEWLDMD